MPKKYIYLPDGVKFRARVAIKAYFRGKGIYVFFVFLLLAFTELHKVTQFFSRNGCSSSKRKKGGLVQYFPFGPLAGVLPQLYPSIS